MNFIELLGQRRSVRQFDPNVRIDRAALLELLDSACRAPSSNNSQPWRFVILGDDPAARAELLPLAYDQPQILTASALILVCADRRAYEEANLAAIHGEALAAGRMDAATYARVLGRGTAFYRDVLTPHQLAQIQGLDIGLWTLAFLLAAEAAGWQTVPMAGYHHEALRRHLNLPEPWDDLLLLALGKATAPGRVTQRRPARELTIFPEERP